MHGVTIKIITHILVCLTYNIQLISASGQLSNILSFRLLSIDVNTKMQGS